MQLSITGVSEKLVYTVLAVLGLNALEVAMALSSGLGQRAATAAVLTVAAYYFVYKTLSQNLAAARNAALGLAVVHAIIAYNSIPLHPYLLIEGALVLLLASVVKDLRAGE